MRFLRLLPCFFAVLVSGANAARSDQIRDLPHLNQPMTAADARHLLERAGIGAHPVEIAALLELDRAQAIEKMLEQLDVTSPFINPPDILDRRYAQYHSISDRDGADRQAFRIMRNQEMDEFRRWWISELISSPNPAGERLLLLWHNHFVTAYSGLNEEVDALIAQHLMLREQGHGSLRDLLHAVIRDAAMLNYLDNSSNRKESPNENLARELLELFVLGEGNYTEQDVKEVARALTGYDYSNLRRLDFHFNNWSHDGGVKTVFGQRGNFDGDDIVDLLLQQTRSATFLTEKFWRAYISEFNSDEQEIARIAKAFRDSDYEIRTLLRSTLSSAAFWAEENRGTIIKSPVDLVIGSIRTSGKLPADWQQLPTTLASLGQNLFEAPNVAGWPGGADWLTPARIVKRNEVLGEYADAPAYMFNAQMPNQMPEQTPVAAIGLEEGLSSDDTIRLRYAAEDFEGPPMLSIRAFADEAGTELIWKSPLFNAQGGLDTARYGRADNGVGLNWQVAEFERPSGGPAPRSFMVAFPNDHCCGVGGSSGGDRNVFIDWVQVQDRIFFANDGIQSPGCRQSNGDNPPGSFYCAGRLTLSKSSALVTPVAADEDETASGLSVGYVHFDGGRELRSERNHSWLTIGLDQVRFEDIAIDAMRLELVAKKINGRMALALRLDQRDCEPACWNDRWPNASYRMTGSGFRNIEIPLTSRSDSSAERQFRQLTPQQKRFYSALWFAIPTLLTEMQSGRQFQRRDGRVILASWQPLLKPVSARLKNSRYARTQPDRDVIIEPADSENASMMSMMMAAMNSAEPIVLGLLRDDLNWTDQPAAAVLDHPVESLLAGANMAGTSQGFSFADLVREPAFQVK